MERARLAPRPCAVTKNPVGRASWRAGPWWTGRRLGRSLALPTDGSWRGQNMTHSRMALRLVWLAAATACSVTLPAQDLDARGTVPPASGPAEAPPAAPPVTFTPAPDPTSSVKQLSPGAAAVVSLTRQGLDESVILAFVRNSRTPYYLSAEDLAASKRAGVTATVLTAMLNHDKSLETPTANGIATGVAASASSPAPARRQEVTPAAPGPGYVWTPGHWQRSGAGWVRVGGSWRQATRPAHYWVRGHWVRSGWRRVWIPGHWL